MVTVPVNCTINILLKSAQKEHLKTIHTSIIIRRFSNSTFNIINYIRKLLFYFVHVKWTGSVKAALDGTVCTVVYVSIASLYCPSPQGLVHAEAQHCVQQYSAVQGTLSAQQYNTVQGTLSVQQYSTVQGTLSAQQYSTAQGTLSA